MCCVENKFSSNNLKGKLLNLIFYNGYALCFLENLVFYCGVLTKFGYTRFWNQIGLSCVYQDANLTIGIFLKECKYIVLPFLKKIETTQETNSSPNFILEVK